MILRVHGLTVLCHVNESCISRCFFMVAHLLAYTGLSALMQMLTALLLHVHDTQLLLKQRAPTAKTVLTGY